MVLGELASANMFKAQQLTANQSRWINNPTSKRKLCILDFGWTVPSKPSKQVKIWTLFQTTLPMFRNKTFTVRRRFSDFLGLYEKLSEKHGPNGFIVPPPPEKSILGRLTGFTLVNYKTWSPSAIKKSILCYTGMTKVKVGKEDSSSADFVERRRGALER